MNHVKSSGNRLRGEHKGREGVTQAKVCPLDGGSVSSERMIDVFYICPTCMEMLSVDELVDVCSKGSASAYARANGHLNDPQYVAAIAAAPDGPDDESLIGG